MTSQTKRFERQNGAIFSPCRCYRYMLWRRWHDGPYCMFIGLNPSTADEVNDDPTVRRCIGYARDWGYGALCMTNAFAYRATNPKDMKAQDYPVGPENNKWLRNLAWDAGIVIAAWGTHGAHMDRGKAVFRLLGGEIHHLGLTKHGHPKHPLYLRKDLKPMKFDFGTAEMGLFDPKANER